MLVNEGNGELSAITCTGIHVTACCRSIKKIPALFFSDWSVYSTAKWQKRFLLCSCVYNCTPGMTLIQDNRHWIPEVLRSLTLLSAQGILNSITIRTSTNKHSAGNPSAIGRVLYHRVYPPSGRAMERGYHACKDTRNWPTRCEIPFIYISVRTGPSWALCQCWELCI